MIYRTIVKTSNLTLQGDAKSKPPFGRNKLVGTTMPNLNHLSHGPKISLQILQDMVGPIPYEFVGNQVLTVF